MGRKMTESTPVFKLDAACVRAGGDRGGAYLDAIGITDLAKLNPAQWEKFCGLVVAGAFHKAMDGWIDTIGCNTSDEAPF
jgi:hypothetical protein